MSGKRGRPPEDRLARRREIYERVAPLILELGPRRLTMRQAAAAACLSLGGLCHYFPTKRELVLHPLQPEAFARLCADFRAGAPALARAGADAYVAAFVEFAIAQIAFVRPALHAALELGAPTFWRTLDHGINAGLDGFAAFLRELVPQAGERDIGLLARSFRRAYFAALLDRTMTTQDMRELLGSLLDGSPLGLAPAAGSARNGQLRTRPPEPTPIG